MKKLELVRHRCFKIPKAKLDLFLIALYMNFSDLMVEHKMEYVFEADENFDVIVAQYGSYPYLEMELRDFVLKLAEAGDVK